MDLKRRTQNKETTIKPLVIRKLGMETQSQAVIRAMAA